jgi:HK97 family phage major capsid protein
MGRQQLFYFKKKRKEEIMLKYKIKETCKDLEVYRKKTKHTVSFREWFEKKYPGKKVEHLLAEVDIYEGTLLEDAMQRTDESKYLVSEMAHTWMQNALTGKIARLSIITQDRNRLVTPEVVLDPINEGVIQGAFYDDLIRTTDVVSADQVTVPKINTEDIKLNDAGELATPETVTITVGKKTVAINKTSNAMEISYEALRRHSLSFVQIYFERVGMLLGARLNRALVQVAINGDQSDGSESAAVIGVGTSGSLTYADIVRASTRMALVYEPPTALLAGEEMAVKWQANDIVTKRQSGQSLIRSRAQQAPIPADLPLYITPNMPANQIQLISRPTAFVQLVEQPLMFETDRFIREQFQLVVATANIGFMNFSRRGRLIVDQSKAINFSTGANYFPSWFNAS